MARRLLLVAAIGHLMFACVIPSTLEAVTQAPVLPLEFVYSQVQPPFETEQFQVPRLYTVPFLGTPNLLNVPPQGTNFLHARVFQDDVFAGSEVPISEDVTQPNLYSLSFQTPDLCLDRPSGSIRSVWIYIAYPGFGADIDTDGGVINSHAPVTSDLGASHLIDNHWTIQCP